MMKRAGFALVLAFSAGASQTLAQEAARPPQVEILASAIESISRMHMEVFPDSTLWQAAVDGLVEAVAVHQVEIPEDADAEAVTALVAARRAELVGGRRSLARMTEPWEAVLSETVQDFAATEVEEVPDSLLWEAAIDGMIDALNDPYAELFTPQESDQWEEDTTGNYSGIGLQITLLNDEITVTAVFRGFPASEHGIEIGDVIVGVDEHDASEWNTDMAADSIRGPVGTDVEVRIKRPGYDVAIPYNITRAQVHVPAVNWGVLDSGIGYVIMDRVARNAAREMIEALEELETHRGLIIDLRRNPGGFLDESLMLADIFLEPGTTLASVVQRVPSDPDDVSSETQSFSDRWPRMAEELPIVVLVDAFTASGAEILAGALQDFDRAIVLGERSFGKGVVQTVMNLPRGRRLRFTTGTWYTPLGRSLQRARDSQGQPLEEELATLPRVTTDGGRSLVDGGGIFPDLEIRGDTLRLPEQNLIRYANEQQFPLGLRLAEFGFEVARARRESGELAEVRPEEFEGFVERLGEEGLPAEMLEDPIVRDYLLWRGKMAAAQRMADIGREADFRMERDPVLTEAVRLLRSTSDQAGLFREVDANRSGAPTGGR